MFSNTIYKAFLVFVSSSYKQLFFSIAKLDYCVRNLMKNTGKTFQFLYARSETSYVLWYGVRPSVRQSIR